LLLATGQRIEEVLEAPWSEFDTTDMLWTIPAERRKNYDKNASNEPHLVPLTDFHLSLLEAITPFSEDSSFLFPHKDGNRPRDHRSLSQAVSRLCARTGFLKFVPKDLRRTWKTLAGSIGIDLEIRNRIQGHAFQDIGSRNYDRYDYLEEKRAAMQRWTSWLDAGICEHRDGVANNMVREQ
jgi:integrase